MMRQSLLCSAILLLTVTLAVAQKYKGPVPEKADVPYLIHGDNLVETELQEAQQNTEKDWMIFSVPGSNSPAKTPLAGPAFLIKAESLAVDKLQAYQLDVQNGRREVRFHQKKPKESAIPLKLSITKVGDNLFRLEVYDSLSNGEYALTPDGSNQVFCFAVF